MAKGLGYRAGFLGLLVCLAHGGSLAARPTQGHVQAETRAQDVAPEQLRQWKNWVLRDNEAWLCPDVDNVHDRAFCAWPGELKLDVRRGGMQFSQSWELQQESAVPLPGNSEYWPRQVTVNGRAHPVLERSDRPVVWLPAGRYTINGSIQWAERPQTIAVPGEVALISLTLEGKSVLPLERHEAEVTLGRGEGAQVKEDSLNVRVFRKLTDAVPARLTTRVQLEVSGKARGWSLSNALPEHFVPMKIASPWAARLDAAGRLTVQVMPGVSTVEIEARLDGPLSEVVPGFSEQVSQEVWSYQDDTSLRSTRVASDKSMLAVDPKQAYVPSDWWSLPAFAVERETHFRVDELSRGQSVREGQRLSLIRGLWLNFSGNGFVARDDLIAKDLRSERLDVAAPYVLERARSSEPLLVTHGADERLTGVEWRGLSGTLNAGVQLDGGVLSRVPVTGWQQSFDSVVTTLHLPYGYKLLAALGVDGVLSQTSLAWLDSWTILDVFFLAFIVLLAYRLLGVAGGWVMAVYLLLVMQQTFAVMDAGVQIMMAVFVMMLALVRRVLPEGRAHTCLRVGERLCLFFLVCCALVFIPYQVRTAFYPQIQYEPVSLCIGCAPAPFDMEAINEEERDEKMALMEAAPLTAAAALPAPAVARLRKAPSQSSLYSQSTVTQTGKGEPDWDSGQRYGLSWSGPVTQEQQMRLLISPPWLTGLLRLLSVACLGWLIWRLVRVSFPKVPFVKLPKVSMPLVAVVLCTALVGLGVPVPASAQSTFPPDSLLKEYQKHLLKAPDCAPDCVDVSEARIEAAASRLQVVLTAHAGADTSMALPMSGEGLTLGSARVDGESRPVLSVQGKNVLPLSRGVHVVQLEYAISNDAVSLSFPIRPSYVKVAGAHWRVEGLYEADGADEADVGKLLNETLNFTRVETAHRSSESPKSAQQFLPFVQVTRQFNFDLDWTVVTVLERLAPDEGGFIVSVPLLPGEHVTTPDVKVQDGQVIAAFPNKGGSVSWSSRLDKTERIRLTASPLTDRSEVWQVRASPTWHVERNDLPGRFLEQGMLYQPLPGETLELTLTEPERVEGSNRAIDRVELQGNFGKHAADITLSLVLRASQAGEHRIGFPAELEVSQVVRNGESLRLQARDGYLSLPVSPGVQRYTLQLRRQEDMAPVVASPDIDVGLPAANIYLGATLDKDRWVLFTSGPSTGPAILYWGELLVALILAFLLTKSGVSSLKYWQWLLLALGFSTFSWWPLFVLFLWLLAVDWRARSTCADWSSRRFNAMQVGLVMLTLLMLFTLVKSVPGALLGQPDMSIMGVNGNGQLNWFADMSDQYLPVVKVFSLPVWFYRALMLAWTLWLAGTLIRWLSKGLSAWLKEGYWRKKAKMPG